MNILLIDDHALFAKSLEIALADYPVIQSFHSCQSIPDIGNEISYYQPDIILVDINLNHISERDGLSVAKHLLLLQPQLKVIMLTGYDLPVYRSQALKIGAKGFVSKSVEPNELVDILMKVFNGHLYFPISQTYFEELTDSERNILQLLSKGCKRKDIASSLYISERTVSNHLQHIFDKLQVTSSVEAITKGITMGYISPL